MADISSPTQRPDICPDSLCRASMYRKAPVLIRGERLKNISKEEKKRVEIDSNCKAHPAGRSPEKGNTMSVLFIEGKRNGYGIDQCGETLTVGELLALLEDYDEDTPIYLRNDGGYTYGSITERDIEQTEVAEID